MFVLVEFGLLCSLWMVRNNNQSSRGRPWKRPWLWFTTTCWEERNLNVKFKFSGWTCNDLRFKRLIARCMLNQIISSISGHGDPQIRMILQKIRSSFFLPCRWTSFHMQKIRLQVNCLSRMLQYSRAPKTKRKSVSFSNVRFVSF